MDAATPETMSPGESGFVDGWRTVAVVSWTLVFLALLAVAVSGRTIGRSVWWLGPEVSPAPVWVVMVPVATVLVPVWTAFRRPRLVGRVGIAASTVLALLSVPDFAERPGVAVAQCVVALAALASSVAITVGTRHYR